MGVVRTLTMRALISILIAGAALAVAGCAATSSEPSADNQALLSAYKVTKQRLDVLTTRMEANKLEDDDDVVAYIADVRHFADELDTLSGTLKRMDVIESLRDETADYVIQLGTTATAARELATAVENGDEKASEQAEGGFVKASVGLLVIEKAIDEELQGDQ